MNYVMQFIVSGSVVVSAVYFSNMVDQKWAGLIVALPLSTLLAYIFLSVGNGTESHQDYLRSAMIFAVPALVFIGSLFFFENRVSFVTNILIGILIFAPLALIANKLIG